MKHSHTFALLNNEMQFGMDLGLCNQLNQRSMG